MLCSRRDGRRLQHCNQPLDATRGGYLPSARLPRLTRDRLPRHAQVELPLRGECLLVHLTVCVLQTFEGHAALAQRVVLRQRVLSAHLVVVLDLQQEPTADELGERARQLKRLVPLGA